MPQRFRQALGTSQNIRILEITTPSLPQPEVKADRGIFEVGRISVFKSAIYSALLTSPSPSEGFPLGRGRDHPVPGGACGASD
jgi:hypothetical protein